jgi:site-specific recombinase XerD
MLERLFADPVVITCLRTNALGATLDDLADRLADRGYASRTIRDYARAGGHFAYWLQIKKIHPCAITEETVDRFLNQHLSQCHCPVPRGTQTESSAVLSHLLQALRRNGLISPPQIPPKTAIDLALEEFGQYLRQVRGATIKTYNEYARHVRKFLQTWYGSGPVDLTSIRAGDLLDFVSLQARCATKPNAKWTTTALRSFLRFMQLRGLCDAHLVNAVPSVPNWKLARLPKGLTHEQLPVFLSSFDRSTPVGQRDYAMAVCLVDLSLRAGEVADLSLDGIDWRAGTVSIISGRTRRPGILPLPARVGRAIARYLHQGRPKAQTRQVFVRHCQPIGTRIGGSAVARAIRRAFERSHLNLSSKGAHVLRHTAASLMIQRGASIKDIADVLRHCSIDTTAIYSKVDLPSLAAVALPWPEVRS